MKGNATWISRDVEWVRWDGDNFDEIRELLGKSIYKIYKPDDFDKNKNIYINPLGTLRVGDYLTKSHRNVAFTDFYEIHSWKTFPRMINEDIGSGLDR